VPVPARGAGGGAAPGDPRAAGRLREVPQPPLLAKLTDTVDEISGERRMLGIGVGRIAAEYRAVGSAFAHRAARLAAGIDIIHGLLRTDQVDVAGTYDRARECELRPRGPCAGRIRSRAGRPGRAR